MPITIRRATIEDARAIAEVKMIGWETTYGPLIARDLLDPLLDIGAQETYQRGVLARSDALTLLAVTDSSEVIGIAVSFMEAHNTPTSAHPEALGQPAASPDEGHPTSEEPQTHGTRRQPPGSR